MALRKLGPTLLVTMLGVGCGGDDGGTTSASDATTTEPTTTEPTTTESTTTGSETSTSPSTSTMGTSETGTGPGTDSSYPNCDEMMMCPDDGVCGGFGDGGTVCMPPCTGPMSSCPDADGATATPFCGVNPMSSTDPCTTEGATDECPEGETCLMTGGGTLACLLPPAYCVLLCGADFGDCPDGMDCAPAGVCQYP